MQNCIEYKAFTHTIPMIITQSMHKTCIISESMGIFMQQFFHQKTTQFFLTVLVTYLFMKYLSPFVTPFLVAFLIVWAMNPYIERVHQKTRFRKSFVAGLLLTIWIILFIWILWIFSYVVMNGLRYFIKRYVAKTVRKNCVVF